MRQLMICMTLIVASTASMELYADEADDTRDAIHLLLKQVAVNPPPTYDVTCYQYSTLKKMTKEETRQFVEEMFLATDEDSPDEHAPEWRRRNMEKEIKRLLDEQERPRKTKLRLRGNSSKMRIDQLILTERPGKDQLPLYVYDESFVNLGFPFDPGFESYRIDWTQANFILEKHKGKQYAYTDSGSWMAGTVGLRVLLVLKSTLGVTPADNEQGYQTRDLAAIDQLVQGTHEKLGIDITEDIRNGKTLRVYSIILKDPSLGEGRTLEAWCDPLDCSKTWKTIFYGRDGHEEYCEVKEFNEKFHFPQVWIETRIAGKGKIPIVREYELIEAHIPAPELTDDFFDFKIADADIKKWSVVDYRVDPPTILHSGVPQATSGVPPGLPLRKPIHKMPAWLFWSNALVLGFITIWLVLRIRRKEAAKK